MPKVTKKAKSVNVMTHMVQRYVFSYTCPSCMVQFRGANITMQTSRFKCDCGQELIIVWG